MGHGIVNIEEIPLKRSLLSINFHSNEIEKISGLTGLNCLTHLDLSSNNLKRIQGLEGLISLQTLNLSSNQITIVEGLFSLKKLTWLNLSYNRIEYLQGFEDLNGPEYNLSIVQLHGNRIDSIDDLIKYLQGLTHLEHLTLRENPLVKQEIYRLKLFNRLKHLISLDGFDRHGRKDENNHRLTGIEQYFRCSIVNSSSNDQNNSIGEQYPKIAAALNSLRHQPKLLDSTTTNETNSLDLPRRSFSGADGEGENESIIRSRSPSSDNQSDRFKRKPLANKLKSTKTNRIESTPRQHPTTTKKTSLENLNDRNRSDDDDIHHLYRRTLKDFDEERNRRWKAEQQIQHLQHQLEEFQQKNCPSRSNEILLEQLNEKHQQRLNDEKSKFHDLTNIIDDYKKRLKSSEDQLSSYRKAQETNLQLIKTLESQLSQLESEKHQIKISENEKVRHWERKSTKCEDENQKLEIELKTTKQQLRDLQELLSNKEIQHKQNLDKCRIDLQSNEVQQYLKVELQRREDLHRNESIHQKEKYETLFNEYKRLEEEFRDALKIEERRFQEIVKTNEILVKENELLQSTSTNLKQREDSDRKMINDLMNLVREQKQRLQDKTKSNESLIQQNKQLNSKLEKTIEELKKIREQILFLQKEKKDFDAKLIAQEAILAGLREEKKLWSQELAHQGASLAQDRGRLESTIQTLTSEINTLKKQLDKEVETCRIKQTIIESQLDTIQKLKDGLIERDETIKKAREDLLIRQKDLEQQLNDEQLLNQDLQNKFDKLNEKRETIKNENYLLQQQLEKIQSDYNQLSKKWKEKSDLINELDSKIRRASETYQNNEKKFEEEKEKLLEKQKCFDEKFRQRDEEFRRQIETIELGHQHNLRQLEKSYEDKIQSAQMKINQVEDEMRLILLDTNQKKKKWEDKIKHLSSFMNQLQD